MKQVLSKKEFLQSLKSGLKGLPDEEIDSILDDYKEHFDVAKSKKKRESTVVKSLGDPKQIAKQFKAEYVFKKAENKQSFGNISRAVFASVGLGFFNLVFTLGIFLGLVGTLIGLFAAAIGIFFGGIATMAAGFIIPITIFSSFVFPPIIGIFIGLGLICFGIIFFIGNCYLTKWFYKLVLLYLNFNLRIIKGEKNEN